MRSPSVYFGMENCSMMAEQKRMEHEKSSSERDIMEAEIWIPQQRSASGIPQCQNGRWKGRLGYSL